MSGSGVAAALALLGARGEVGGDGETAAGDLFGEFEAQDAPQPLASKPRAGPGRPPGARNRSTEEWARYVLSRHRSPLTILAEIYSRPLAELVDELQQMADKHAVVKVGTDGCFTVQAARINPLDVLKLQRDAAAGLAPYLHKQQPKALEIESRPAGLMILGDIEAADQVDDDLALPLPAQENQQLSAPDPKKSDGD